jgi:sialate O-acetylesterase
MKRILKVVLLFFALNSTVCKAGDLWLPAIFSDNMVLQREMNVPVWGKAKPGTTVTIEIAGMKVQTIAGIDGKWLLHLPSMPAGGPYEMKVLGEESISYKNVMFGDVWIASGQSNMNFALSGAKNAKQEIAEANYPNIRLFTVPNTLANNPKTEVPGKNWSVCDPSTVKDFSAVAYFFGRKLFLDKNVPIGLIHTSWGGTPAESWVSQEMVSILPEYKKMLEDFKSKKLEESFYVQNIKNDDEKWRIANTSFVGLAKKVQQPQFNDQGWKSMFVPKSIDESVIGPYEGIIWFRKTIELPASFKGKDLIIKLGGIDHMDYTYFNGVEIGHSAWTTDWIRTYKVPKELVKKGKNVIVVRDADLWSKGGLNGPADSMYINTTTEKTASAVSLAGDWKYNNELEPVVPKTIGVNNIPSLIYNAMIAPLIPYGIKGAIWYQGEANAWKAYQYRILLPMMITDWRTRWGEGNFPFFIVQLTNFMKPQIAPEESDWAELREAQSMTTNYPNVGMACILDLGDAVNIHPTNKQDVGYRLGLSAEKIAYGDNLVYTGPTYQSMKIEGQQIRLKFTNTGSGIITRGDKVKGFTIAGSDKKFYWADAKIEGDEIIVSSDKVKEPFAVRYAWANNPIFNVYNKEGLPALPFRTDTWPGITANNK